ncbi:MAG: site-2 protease family protein [Opitutales bacterium]
MRLWSIKLFRLLGIRIELHLTFFLLLLPVAWITYVEAGLSAALGVTFLLGLHFACLLLHELGHCVTAQQYGIHVERILFLPIGGMAQFSEIPRDPKAELAITLAGPMVNFILAGAAWLLLGAPTALDEWRPLIAFVTALDFPAAILPALFLLNLLNGIFNLLPIFPMDGGRIFRALMALRMNHLQATRVAVYAGKVLAVLGILFALSQQLWLLAALFAFIFYAGAVEYDIARRNEQLAGVLIGDIATPPTLTLQKGRFISDALDLLGAYPQGGILVLDGPVVVGRVPLDKLKILTTEGRLDEPLYEHMEQDVRILQADWPIELFAELLFENRPALYPVYQGARLVGVVDTSRLSEALFWAQHRRRLRETIFAEMPPAER